VSHDRRFLDNVVTQTLAAEGDGVWREYPGGYSDYLQQRPQARLGRAPAAGGSDPGASRDRSPEPALPKARVRLSYQEQRELAALPQAIETLELEQAQLTARMSAPTYHRQDAGRLRADRKRLEELEALLLEKFARWEWLEEQLRAAGVALRQGR
jgi:ATP-binding cassette subfamily F protein uup